MPGSAGRVFPDDPDYAEYADSKRSPTGYLVDLRMQESENHHASFDFSDLWLKNTTFCYNGHCVTKGDYHEIFEAFRELSKAKLFDILYSTGHPISKKYRPHMVDRRGYPKLFEFLIQQFGFKPNVDSNELPQVFQISLYNSDRGEKCEDERLKAPRIYFVIGPKAKLLPCGIDLYHEFYPTVDRSSS